MTRRKLHSLTGAVPLPAYLLLHLWETAGASAGRRPFAARVFGGDGSPSALVLESLLVLLPLAVHVGLGLAMAIRDRGGDDAGSYPTRGRRTVQRVTGVAALVFVLAHLSHTWFLTFDGHGAAFVYDVLREELGRPFWLGIYIVGLTCVCVHAAQGIGAAVKTWNLVDTDAGARAVRVVGMVVAFVMWVVFLDAVSHFAVGRALVFGADTEDEPPGTEAEATAATREGAP